MQNPAKITLCAFVLAPLFMPWFNFNPLVTTGCWGYNFAFELAIPIILIIVSALGRFWGRKMLGTFGLVSYATVLVLAIGLWQQKTNVHGGFDWSAGINAFMWGYWASVACLLLAAVLFVLISRRGPTSNQHSL